MNRQPCTAYARREAVRYLLIGLLTLAAGAALACLLPALGMLRDARDLLPGLVVLFLIVSGAYLAFSGARGLFRWEAADLCRFLRAELPSEMGHLTGKELLALADRDLEGAAGFSDGRILIGEEWLFVGNAWGKPILRLEHLVQIRQRETGDGRVLLKFQDRQGAGPATRELSAAEADAIRAHLQGKLPDLRV